MALQMFRAMGASEVVAIDILPSRLELAAGHQGEQLEALARRREESPAGESLRLEALDTRVTWACL